MVLLVMIAATWLTAAVLATAMCRAGARADAACAEQVGKRLEGDAVPTARAISDHTTEKLGRRFARFAVHESASVFHPHVSRL